MARVETEKIRNIAIVGHEGAGKTMLAEAFLNKTGITTRMGSIKEGNTASDFDPDEREAGKSFYCVPVSFKYKDIHFNFLDVPGSPDCIGEALTALRAVECALICVDATSGVKVNTRKMWQEAEKIGLVYRQSVVTPAAYDQHSLLITSLYLNYIKALKPVVNEPLLQETLNSYPVVHRRKPPEL